MILLLSLVILGLGIYCVISVRRDREAYRVFLEDESDYTGWLDKPVAKKRGRPLGSKNRPKNV